MQTLEYAEQLVRVPHIESHAVVPHEYHRFFSFHTSYLDFSLLSCARELHRIGKKIYKHKPQHRAVSIERRQSADFPGNLSPLGIPPHLTQRFLQELLETYKRFLCLRSADSGKGQQIVDEITHPFGGFKNCLHVAAALFIYDRRNLFLEKLRISSDVPQRRSEVVRNGVGECLEFLVDGLQFYRTPGKLLVQIFNLFFPSLALRSVVACF